mmetsp:Transcript_44580/g.73800  ORF Transcript_44580/g.73800 Transcript_44580/m.73800 type:complete len:251 (-) Transcript_44580:140-892(-)
MVHQDIIEIFAAQMCIARGGFDLKHAIVNRQQRHIKSTATEIENQHILFRRATVLFVQTIRDCRGGWFVDDTQYIQTRNFTSIFGGLSLRIVEIGRHGHHCIVDGTTQIRLCDLFHVTQHHGTDLLWKESLLLRLILDLDSRAILRLAHHFERPQFHVRLHGRIIVLSANQSLGVKHGILGVSCSLILGRSSDQSLSVRKRDVRRCGSLTHVVWDNLHCVVLPCSDARVRGSQINTNRWLLLLLVCHNDR